MNTFYKLLAAICLAGLMALVLISPLPAHEAHSPSEAGTGWQYDKDCCGEQDCAPITGSHTGPDGKVYYTNKYGTKAFEEGFTKLRPSQDQFTHACIFGERLWCLYVPGGM